MLYNPPTGGAANDSYVGKNVAAGVQGSKVPPGAAEFPQREIVAVEVAAGLTPTNSDLQQLLKATRSGKLNYFQDTGTADALLIVPNLAITAAYSDLSEGTEIIVRKGAAPNATATPTMTVSGLTMTLVKQDGTSLAPGDLPGSAIFAARSDGAALRVRGLVKSDAPQPPAPVVHIGDDTSESAGTIVANVAPAITAYATDHVYAIGVANACTGATNAEFCGLPNRPIMRNDYSALQAGDWPQFARLVLVDNGTSLNLVGLTVNQVQELAASSTTINTTTLNFINGVTPNGANQLSAFTPNVVVTDIAQTPGFTTVQQTGNVTGTTYLDVSATCALHDNAGTGSEGSGTARLALNDLTTGAQTLSNYVGGGAFSQGTQVSLVVPRVIFHADPTHTYNLSLVCQKGSTVGPTEIFDTYIFAQHNGTNQ